MRRVPTLMRRELIAYFRSPMVYFEAAGLLGIVTLATWSGLGRGPKELVPGIMGFASFLMMFIVPILTMRLLAHEKDTGAMEILVTDPVTDWDIVLGKFLAAVLALWAILLPLALFPVLYALVGKSQFAADVAWYRPWNWLPKAIDYGPILTGTLSVALLGALFVSVGLFASSLTGNQAVSALVGFVIILVLWVFGWVSQLVETGQAAELIDSLSLYKRQELLLRGQLDTRPIFLFVSTIILMLYLTVRSVESRKWR
jgi:ABC-2 type transport system permease protein